jgi:translation initiation factor IF-3
MFEKSKKEKDKQNQPKEKEVAFRYVTDDHDLETKAGHIKKFLAKDMKVKLVVKFKAREKAHKEKGFDVLNKVIEMLKDVAAVEYGPKLEGITVIARLDKKKDSKK